MAEGSSQLNDEPDRRAEERQTMVMRVGLLEQAGKPSFCLVRNISPSGVQVKLYSSVVRPGKVIVRVADENPFAGDLVWIDNENAGISFDSNLDPASLLRVQQKASPVRRRSIPRVKAASYAALRICGRTVPAVLQDISSMGARLTTSRPLEVGAAASIRIPDLPELRAYVRWTECSNSGLAFERPIPIAVIGAWIDGRLRVGT